MKKIRIYFTVPPEGVPFNYQHSLMGLFHNWLGENSLHGEKSTFSLGWLKGNSSAREDKIWFRDPVTWDIGLPSSELEEKVKSGMDEADYFFYGMKAVKSETLPEPDFSGGSCRFFANSPVLLRKSAGKGKRRHLIFSDPESDALLTASARRKAEELGLEDAQEICLRFDRADHRAKTRLVSIKSVKLRGSVCPLLAEGPPQVLKALWVTGAGELTGSAFGALDHPDHRTRYS